MTTLSYDDVLLQPQYSDIRSRSEIDMTTDLGRGLVLATPIFSSPMDTVTEGRMAVALGESGGCGIIHRYNTVVCQQRFVERALTLSRNTGINVGAAIGITGDYLERAEALIKSGVAFLCVDVAHGHHILMKEALAALREKYPDLHLMAGNVATLEAVNDLSDWGADSVRCNIGGGSICTTRIQTGHGVPGLHTVLECAKTDRNVKIIADGGIRNSGDIVKALAAGADAVMCGSLFAGCTEAPGEVFRSSSGETWKTYRGMASKEAQSDWKGNYSSLEGVASKVPYRGSVSVVLNDLRRGIRSGFSYTGARNIEELHAKAQFIEQTTSGLTEGHPHIMGRTW